MPSVHQDPDKQYYEQLSWLMTKISLRLTKKDRQRKTPDELNLANQCRALANQLTGSSETLSPEKPHA